MRRHLNPLHNPFPTTTTPPSPDRSYVTQQDSRLLHWRPSSSSSTTTGGSGLDDRNFRIHGQTLLYIFILFSIILLATLLLLYARWFFRIRHLSSSSHHHRHHHHPRTPPDQLILHISRPAHHHRHSLGLDRASIDLIPIVLYQSSSSSSLQNNPESECCICLGMFEDGDKVKILPQCRHCYHSDCVDAWLCSHSSCPLCRLPVRVDPDPPPDRSSSTLLSTGAVS